MQGANRGFSVHQVEGTIVWTVLVWLWPGLIWAFFVGVDNREDFRDVADRITENFYVDNYLDSVETEEAIQRAERITELLKLGSFRLTKSISSSRKVLASVDAGEFISPHLDLDLDELLVQRTLGVL